MKPSLTPIIRRILYRHPAARVDKVLAFQLYRNEMAEKPDVFNKTNPDSFARIWRRHKKSF